MYRQALVAVFLLCSAAGSVLAAPVRGTVTTAEGVPLAGARVELVPVLGDHEWARMVLVDKRVSGLPTAATESDTSGRFTLEAPAAGVWKVRVEGEGFVGMSSQPLCSMNPVELPPLALLPAVGATVEVRSPAGVPVSEAWVLAVTARGTAGVWQEAFAGGWKVTPRSALTDRKGRAEVPRAPGEALDFTAFLPGTTHIARVYAAEQASLELPAAAESPLILEVRGANDEPVERAAVAVGLQAWPAGLTDERGRLELASRFPLLMHVHVVTTDGRQQTLKLRKARGEEKEPVPITLAPAVRLAGRVVERESREPIPGAMIWPGHDPGGFVFTDARGAWELQAPAGSPTWLHANAPGYLARIERLPGGVAASGRPVVFKLPLAAVLEGWVTDTEDRPLAGVRLEAGEPAAPEAAEAYPAARAASRAVSGPDGRFQLWNLDPRQRYDVTASRAGFAPFERARVRAGREPLRVRLEPSSFAFGKVVDDEGRPIPEAEVILTRGSSEQPGRNRSSGGLSDEAGRFEGLEVPAQKFDVQVSRDGYAPSLLRDVEKAPGVAEIDLGDLVLRRGATIRGRVTDPDGRALGETRVWIGEDLDSDPRRQQRALEQTEPQAVTDPGGRFSVADLQQGQRVHLYLAREGYLPASVLEVKAPSTEPVEVVLEPASQMEGTVVSETGEAIPGARVDVRHQVLPPGVLAPRGEGRAPHPARSDDEGRFTFRDVASGAFELRASAAGFLPSSPLEVEVLPGTMLDDLLLVVERGAVVEGSVSAEAGEPIAGARVQIGPASTVSDENGAFRLRGVPQGRQTLAVRHQGYQPAQREVDVENGVVTRISVVLEGGWVVTGRVRGETEEAVEGARLELQPSGGWGSARYETMTDSSGGFQFPHVASGIYDLEVTKDEYAATCLKRAIRVEEGPVEGLEVSLWRGAVASGRVLGLGLEDLAVVRVRAEGEAGTSDTIGVSHRGEYEIDGLGPGVWSIIAWLPGGSRSAAARVAIHHGDQRVVRDLEFVAGLILSGQVLFGGEPSRGTRVSLSGHDRDVERSVLTDYQGRFQIEDLKRGPYRLSLSNPLENLFYNEDLELLADEERMIEIATFRVSGEVTSAVSAHPLGGAVVSLLELLGADDSRTGSRVTITTDSNGFFSILRLPAGTYRMTAQKEGYAPFEQLLAVAPGAELDNLDLALVPTEGLDFVVRLASGATPPYATVGVLGADGQLQHSETQPLGEDGFARFLTLPPGSWELLIAAPGGSLTKVRAAVPGPPVEIVLPPAARLFVQVPALTESDRTASVQLLDFQGRAFQQLKPAGIVEDRWPVSRGSVVVEGVPAGDWLLRVVSSDGQRWEQRVATFGTELSLQLE